MTKAKASVWRKKVAPKLLERYDRAVASEESETQRIIVEYRGNHKSLHSDAEVLSLIDDQLQVSIPLRKLPELAAMRGTKDIRLP